MKPLQLFSILPWTMTLVSTVSHLSGCGPGIISAEDPEDCSAERCAELGKNCGQVLVEGCGLAECGDCASPDSCGGGGTENVCGREICVPTWECEQPLNGYEKDGCENRRSNAACDAPSVCGDGVKDPREACDVEGNVGCSGATPVCQPDCSGCIADKPDCTETRCRELGKECGEIEVDGCDAVQCGECEAPETCGGAGTPNLCGRPQTGKTKIMPLGDSVTAGYGSYRNKLWTLLAAGGYQIDFVGSQSGGPNTLPDKDHEGHGGWSTTMIDKEVNTWMTTFEPQYVLLHIGTNDIIGTPTSVSETRLSSIIDKINAKLPGTLVLVATIIPLKDCLSVSYLPVKCGYAAYTKPYNAMVRKVAEQKKSQGKPVHLVDIFDEAGITDADLGDGIHPNASGSEKMANVWFDHLKTVF